jgi:low affinity Fe/Cu permease
MQKVDEYIRRSQAAQKNAELATHEAHKSELQKIAEEWERLAKERLELLEERLKRGSLFAGPEPQTE